MNHELLFTSPVRAPSPNPFLSLTIELKQAIFSELADISRLKSLILTCSSYFHAFLNAKSLIINSVLQTHIGSDLIYDAIIVWKSRKITAYHDDAANEILDSYVKRNLPITCMLQTLRLRDAEDIGGLHDQIEDFSSSFVSSALGTSIVTGLENPCPSSLSLLECTRIKRIFYRFELLCNTIGQRYRSSIAHIKGEELLTNFFSVYQPWENEQLGCIQEHFYDRLSSHFNKVAERDVEWDQERIEYVGKRSQHEPRKDHYVTLGLSYLHQLFNTFSYEGCYRLLEPQKKSPNFSFIHAFVFESSNDVLAALRRYSEDEVNLFLVEKSARDDDDEGPEKAWRWVFNETFNIEDLYGTYLRKIILRTRGFVMWDSARLAEWGLLYYDWRDLPNEEPIDDT